MAYKRKARLLFAAGGDVSRALLALDAVRELGGGWIEARALVLKPLPLPETVRVALAAYGIVDRPLPAALDAAELGWADLLVTLDAEAEAACPTPPCGQRRCYPFVAPSDAATVSRIRAEIRARIAGMVGGMRMLSRGTES